MPELRTNVCHLHGHSEFRLRFDSEVTNVRDAEWLIETLTAAVVAGHRHADGESIQIGWVSCLLRETADCELSLLEPDMLRMPVEWRDSVNQVLLHLRVQRDTYASYFSSGEPSFPSMRESCLVCGRLDATTKPMLSRFEPAEHDSGWYFGCPDSSHDHDDPGELRRVSLYEAIVTINGRPLPWLAMPPGVSIDLGSPSCTVFHGGVELHPSPGSFVADRATLGTAPAN